MATYGFLSSFPPTRCGLATFADSLARAMTTGRDSVVAVRVIDHAEGSREAQFAHPSPGAAQPSAPVVETLVHGDPATLASAVKALNATDVAVIQHEYGIYGGPDGDEVVDVMRALHVPTIAVLHTVVDSPTSGQRWVLEEVVRLANATVVMSRTALARLRARYAIDASRVHVIPHGVTAPPTALADTREPHAATPAPATATIDRPVILTWGLLGPGKGIEWGIRALTHLGHLDPPPLYRVLGQTHPKVLARDGERYRDSLTLLATALGHTGSFDFQPAYLDRDTLNGHIAAASVVLLPYDSTVQITSGVLAEALAAGKPVVATAFPHAVELLASGAGTVVRHGDARAIAHALESILTRPHLARMMSRHGREYGKEASWPAVGAKFTTLAHKIATEVAV